MLGLGRLDISEDPTGGRMRAGDDGIKEIERQSDQRDDMEER
jgi:hypothetical protein